MNVHRSRVDENKIRRVICVFYTNSSIVFNIRIDNKEGMAIGVHISHGLILLLSVSLQSEEKQTQKDSQKMPALQASLMSLFFNILGKNKGLIMGNYFPAT